MSLIERARRCPLTLMDAAQKVNPVKQADGRLDENGNGINITSILTELIQLTGRFTERFASDLLFGTDELRALTKLPENPDDWNAVMGVVFGIREDGVDHDTFVINRLRATARGTDFISQYVYRRIMLCVVTYTYDPAKDTRPYADFKLYDITKAVTRIHPTDKEA